MQIRDARPTDVETIAQFNERLADDSDDVRPDPETLRRGVQRALSSPALARYFIGEDDGVAIGQCMVTTELTDWRDGLIWWFQSVYVVPERRGQGVFNAFYEHVKKAALASADCRALRLYVLENNERARRAYERAGMTRSDYLIYEEDWSLSHR